LLQQFVPKDINLSSDQFTPELEVLEINLFTQSLTVDINYGVLFLLAVSGLNVYGIIIAG
jgi:NADH:ubiquinone oxidoreductase subunit H